MRNDVGLAYAGRYCDASRLTSAISTKQNQKITTFTVSLHRWGIVKARDLRARIAVTSSQPGPAFINFVKNGSEIKDSSASCTFLDSANAENCYSTDVPLSVVALMLSDVTDVYVSPSPRPWLLMSPMPTG